MVLKSEIEKAALEQRLFFEKKEIGQPRAILDNISLNKTHILIITGIRRCGKSTLMLQLMRRTKNEFAFFNFEDPRIFGFEKSDFTKLDEVIGNKPVYFFDEIQNTEGWEVFVRKLNDRQKIICITGSNASLLSRELGTRLTGRNIQAELFPFSFSEYIAFKKLKPNEESFESYLNEGGFPDYITSPNKEILQQLFKDIIYRDIIVRHGIRNTKALMDIALFLISNAAKEYSLNSLKKVFGLGSANTAGDYIQWLEDSYVLFSLPRFSWSSKNILVNPRKVYVIDTGFAKANSLSFSDDKGRLLENSVYLHLRRKHKELYYFREKGECDFIVKEGKSIVMAVQVCAQINGDNIKRELAGILEALQYFKLDKGFIITQNQEDELEQEGKKVLLVPAWKWLKG